MRETLTVIGLFVVAVALRSSCRNSVRKLGAVLFLTATFFLFYFPTGMIGVGVLGAGMWFLLPWIELLTRVRRMRLPLNNRLSHRAPPDPSFFPNAPESAAAMEEDGFEHVSDCGWEWAGMKQFFRLYWHPEERAVAAVCLCEQCDVAFAFISITSYDCSGNIWRTTNFPFAPTLRCPPYIRWNHVPCERSCFHQILQNHREYLTKNKLDAKLRVPDPEEIEDSIEKEMRRQVEHNLEAGIIRLTPDGHHFKYSGRGMIFLWGQFVKDMIRLC
ncbi:hypothetical protein JIN85_07735 [Luteolibacter pohnpeiensis]|uniref:Uncharacterized protein n=1 Tax=Luteolibacter pohnpeiensis TaxID=454153 RepID=A0A934S6R9_9BACT|nr:hypothetical protein [Luteolibacter pohnpeiensis]MBK1882300.1 hypothetical protein [Luteolibacter pohnpeiensis]